jgi:hypothetical protein
MCHAASETLQTLAALTLPLLIKPWEKIGARSRSLAAAVTACMMQSLSFLTVFPETDALLAHVHSELQR